ncbi:MAG: hypothetical protein ABS37_22955 [Acidovorax sp. SCN 65-108]|nr:MAG: hypothetical protein ABS37_22955 [Acidovorax sp. SCN 65-108]OJV73590.1 MAG: hypothetical protein BGO35_13480 [Burkholderiales bacterium 64-34]
MVTSSSLSSLAGLAGLAPRTDALRPARDNGDTARLFGYTGSDAVARTLSVPPFSGDTPAQLQSRFIDCLFTRG